MVLCYKCHKQRYWYPESDFVNKKYKCRNCHSVWKPISERHKNTALAVERFNEKTNKWEVK